MPRAVLLSQGDELTTGQTVDTNSNWLAGKLWALGLPIRRVITAPDDLDEIVAVLREAAALGDVVVSTGGIGPTRDDLTAEAAALAFGRPLEEEAEALAQVEARYAVWGRPMMPSARKQALLPKGCRVLENHWGTAPAFAVDAPGCTLFFLPGVPGEMRPLFENHVEPELRDRYGSDGTRLTILRCTGVPESELEQRLVELRAPGLTVGFRAMPGEVQIKLRFDGDVSAERRDALLQFARERLGGCVFGQDSGDLSDVVGALLAERGETLALAESCTAGRLAAWIASVPGASRYLLEGSVVYSNEAKERTAAVPHAMLEAHGAVSEPVARQLAEGIRARAGATWGVGITGVAGPGGGTPEKPVGTVFIGVAGPGFSEVRHLKLSGDRDRVQALSAAAALALLLEPLRGSAVKA